MSKSAVLLINLGSPDSAGVSDVRRYLRQFLSDKYVIDIPWLLRKFLLEAIILPTRPKKSAEAYQKIFTAEGSPLVVISEKQRQLLAKQLTIDVELAMRYGNPSIPGALKKLAEKEVSKLIVIPLYPQYAMSSYLTVIEEVKKHNKGRFQFEFVPAFYDEKSYLTALTASIKKALPAQFDHFLFSYHGLPERQITKVDPTGQCLSSATCCENPGDRLPTCYRAQSFYISNEISKRLKLPTDKVNTVFQSRLGRTPWLTPYADEFIVSLAENGVKKLVVACPSFVTDCLETLEEIEMRASEDFIAAGGEKLTLIPCLNESPLFIKALAEFVEKRISA